MTVLKKYRYDTFFSFFFFFNRLKTGLSLNDFIVEYENLSNTRWLNCGWSRLCFIFVCIKKLVEIGVVPEVYSKSF